MRASRAFAAGTFDLYASSAIEEREVDMDIATFHLCAGVAHVETDSSALVVLALKVSFVQNNVLDPLEGLASFLPAWGSALGEEDDIPATDIYYTPLSARFRARDAAGAGSVYVTYHLAAARSWKVIAS